MYPCRKNIFAPASSAAVGHGAGAEALRAKGISPNPISITSADVRRPSMASNVSAISMSGIENGAGGGLMEPLDGHVPHLLCKSEPQVLRAPPLYHPPHAPSHANTPTFFGLLQNIVRPRDLQSDLLQINVLVIDPMPRLYYPNWAIAIDCCGRTRS